MADIPGLNPAAAPSGTGCVECEAGVGLVVPPAPVRPVRAHRLL